MFVREAYKPSSVIGGHLSRPIVTGGFKRNPESSTGRLKRSFVSCCGWGLHRGQVAMPRVSSYLTFPPLHAQSACGISLLHFPWGRPRRVLPGTLPCAARTFLTPFGARPPGNLTNAEIIARLCAFVNEGNVRAAVLKPVWGHRPQTPSPLRGGIKQPCSGGYYPPTETIKRKKAGRNPLLDIAFSQHRAVSTECLTA